VLPLLARAHARSGDRWQLRDRMGGDRSFETELSAFAVAYADQVEADHRLLLQALAAGRLKS